MSKFRAYASDALITLAIHALLLSVFAARAFSVDPEYYSVSGLRCMHSVRNFDVFSAQDIIIVLFLATAAGFALSAMEKWSERRRGAVLREIHAVRPPAVECRDFGGGFRTGNKGRQSVHGV